MHTCNDNAHALQRQGPQLPAELTSWPVKEGAWGTAYTLRYLKEEQAWEKLPASEVSYRHPDTAGQVPRLSTLLYLSTCLSEAHRCFPPSAQENVLFGTALPRSDNCIDYAL